MADRRFPGIVGERLAGEEYAPRPQSNPIDGPPRPLRLPSLSTNVLIAVCAGLLLVVVVVWRGLPAPAARPALDETAPSAAPVAQEAQAQAAPIAPSAPPATTLADGAIAYDSPDGATLGDVSGRAVGELVELAVLESPSPRGAMWVRGEVAGAGLVWLPLGAFAGQAVALADLPCRGACSPPTATPRPYVAPAPVYVPPPPVHVVATLEAPAAEILVVEGPAPTIDISKIPTPRP